MKTYLLTIVLTAATGPSVSQLEYDTANDCNRTKGLIEFLVPGAKATCTPIADEVVTG